MRVSLQFAILTIQLFVKLVMFCESGGGSRSGSPQNATLFSRRSIFACGLFAKQ